MIESYFRPVFHRLLINPVVMRIARQTCWKPIAFTFIAGFLGILGAVALWLGYPVIACLFILSSGYLDAIDGALAREKGMSTSKGAVLDIVMDRVVEFAIMLGLFIVDPITRGMPIIFMLGSTLICVTSFLVVGVFIQNKGEKGFHYSVGIMERAEAFLFFVVMILRPEWFLLLAWTYTALVFVTATVRVFQFFYYSSVSLEETV